MSFKSKMTIIADKIRTLLGITETMGLDAMAENIQTAQTEVDAQNGLIAQISDVLKTKAAGIIPSGTKGITENGMHDVTEYASVDVNIFAKLQDKTVTPTKSNQAVTADSGYDGLGQVTINGDNDLKPENIMKGVDVFGVVGTLEKGVIVQKKSGTFTTDNNGNATVECGFKPDCVYVNGGKNASISLNAHSGAMFTEGNYSVVPLLVPSVDIYYRYTILKFERKSSGFSVYAEKKFNTTSLDSAPEKQRAYNYTAIKYT